MFAPVRAYIRKAKRERRYRPDPLASMRQAQAIRRFIRHDLARAEASGSLAEAISGYEALGYIVDGQITTRR